MECVFADINADHGNCAVVALGHGVLLCLWSPLPDSSLAGQVHGRTIPLADIRRTAACHLYLGNFRSSLALSESVGSPYPRPTVAGACPTIASSTFSERPERKAIALKAWRHAWFGDNSRSLTPRLRTHPATYSLAFT